MVSRVKIRIRCKKNDFKIDCQEQSQLINFKINLHVYNT